MKAFDSLQEAIQSRNFDIFKKYVSKDVTSFDPAVSVLVKDLEYHKFNLSDTSRTRTTVTNKLVKILTKKSAITTCVVLQQRLRDGNPVCVSILITISELPASGNATVLRNTCLDKDWRCLEELPHSS